jgi:hypothetical protein
MLFIIIRSTGPEVVPRVFQIAQETKRLRQLEFDDDDDELRQYVIYDQEQQAEDPSGKKKKHRKVIKLDDQPAPLAIPKE